MKSVVPLLAFALLAESACAFSPLSPAQQRLVSMQLEMGLFDKKPAPKKGPAGGKDLDVFGGRGKRITVREDEDNAMWVEEPKKPQDKKKGR
jgi:hypothetical protein